MFRKIFKIGPQDLTRILRMQKISSVVKTEIFDEICYHNEYVLDYLETSREWRKLLQALECTKSKCEHIPIVINGVEYTTKKVCYQVMPHDHQKKIAKFYYADGALIEKAIDAAVESQKEWDEIPFSERIDIWERAACLMAKEHRAELVATTMLGQSKTIVQAEIDAACELIDFTRMNAAFLKEALKYKPISLNPEVTKNHIRYRGLEGFVAAISPFNFTAIGGNLAYTPALMGNAVVWKPSDKSVLSNWRIFNIMREAGVPDGVVNFVTADGPTFLKTVTYSKHLAGINFTGSQEVFNEFYRQVGKHINWYKNYPRVSGECSGKNFHFVHWSADVDTVVASTIRSAFEYGGQKCSACSCLYAPKSLWKSKLLPALVAKTNELKIGNVMNREVFYSAVIDDTAFKRIANYIYEAHLDKNCEIIAGGNYTNLKGYFIEPTVIVVKSMQEPIFVNEIFGPILAVYVYEDKKIKQSIDNIKQSKYALTGAVFAQDQEFLQEAMEHFKMCAGNLYLNDKSTGAIVGQQPFGGARKSGTNDKPGGPHYILRWTTPQTIKETFKPMTDIYYPYMNVKNECEKIENKEKQCQ